MVQRMLIATVAGAAWLCGCGTHTAPGPASGSPDRAPQIREAKSGSPSPSPVRVTDAEQLYVDGTPSDSCLILLDQATIVGLRGSGQRLFAYLAFATPSINAMIAPLLDSNQYGMMNQLRWSWLFDGMVQWLPSGPDAAPPGALYTARSELALGVGQLMVLQTNGSVTVQANGQPDLFGWINQTDTPVRCGLGLSGANSKPALISVMLHGNNSQWLQSLPKALFMFASFEPNPDVQLATATGPAILVTLATNKPVVLYYDINLGWRTGVDAYQIVPVETPLAPLIAPAL